LRTGLLTLARNIHHDCLTDWHSPTDCHGLLEGWRA